MLGFVDEVMALSGSVPPMQKYDTDGKPVRSFNMMDPVEKTPGIPEVRSMLGGLNSERVLMLHIISPTLVCWARIAYARSLLAA